MTYFIMPKVLNLTEGMLTMNEKIVTLLAELISDQTGKEVEICITQK